MQCNEFYELHNRELHGLIKRRNQVNRKKFQNNFFIINNFVLAFIAVAMMQLKMMISHHPNQFTCTQCSINQKFCQQIMYFL